MKRRLQRAVSEWLRQERSGEEQRAEKALFKVFARLPQPSLPAGFADRVLLRVGLEPVPMAAGARAATWCLKAALSLSLALAALSVLLLPGLMPSILGIVNPERLTEIGVTTLVAVFQRVGVGLLVWRALSNIGSILASALSSPTYLSALAASTLLSIGAFRLLHSLMLPERSSRHVASA